MTKDEFVKACAKAGYCSEHDALIYAKTRQEFTEEDFVEAFRYAQKLEFLQRRANNMTSIGKGCRTSKKYKVYNSHGG